MRRCPREGGCLIPGILHGVARCSTGASAPIVGWDANGDGRKAAARRGEVSRVVVPARSKFAGKDRTRSRAKGRSCSWPMRLIASPPFGAWSERSEGEARRPSSRAEHRPAPDGHRRSPAEASLWEQVFSARTSPSAQTRRGRMLVRWHRRMSTEETAPGLRDHWPLLCAQLDAGTYRPQPVRRV